MVERTHKKPNMNTTYIELIGNISIKMRNWGNTKLRDSELSPPQGRMISYIYENQKRGIIQKDLADKFNIKRASITSMLQGLEKKGYIERVILEHDERQKRVYVLEKGINLIEEFDEAFKDLEKNLIKNLTNEEANTLKKLLLKVDASL